MAAYYEDHQGRIYADIAYRLGVIVKQYDYYIDSDNDRNYDSTMCVSFLQNLLTIYCEYWNNEKFGLPSFWRDPLYHKDTLISESNYFGIKPSMVLENNIIMEKQTILSFLTHIRNAVSHPTAIAANSKTQSTGYYSMSDNLGRISKYVFIDSPDVKVDRFGKNRTKIFDDLEKFFAHTKNSKLKDHPYYYQKVNGKIELLNHRIFKVSLTSRELKNLVVNLSSLLAQPIQSNWDGKVINPKILEYAA